MTLRFGNIRLFVLVISCLLAFPVTAQESPERLDSVVRLLDPQLMDTAQMDLLIIAAESWTTSENAKPYLARLDTLTLALLRSDDPAVRRRGRHGRGAFHFFTGYQAKFARNIPLALRSLRNALVDFQEFNEWHALAETNDALGVLFNAAGRPERALSFYLEELRLGREIQHRHVTDQALLHIAAIHAGQREFSIAAAYLDSCVPSSPADRSAVLVERARIESLQGHPERSVPLLDQALILAQGSTNPWDQLPVLAPLARAYYDQADPENGASAARTCARVAAEVGDRTAQCGCTVLEGIGRMSLGQWTEAERILLEGLALAQANNNVGVARELGDEGSMLRATELLKDLYRKQGRIKEALAMTEHWVMLKDSVARMDGRDDLLLFEFDREQYTDSLAQVAANDLQQAEHERSLAAEQARRNFLALTILFLLAIVLAVWSRIRLLRRSNAAILAAQDQLLKSESALAGEAVRNRIASDVHDELGADLTKVIMLSNEAKYMAEHDRSALDPTLERLSAMAHSASGTLKDIVWSVDPAQDTWKGLIQQAHAFCQRQFEHSGIKTEFHFEHMGPDATIDPATRRDIFLVLKEACNNALKHAKARAMRISLTSTEEGFDLSVSDDGIGVDPTTASTEGNGIRNMQKRAERLNATLSVTISGTEGTVVELKGQYAR